MCSSDLKRIKEVANPIEMEISIHGAKAETHEKLTCVPGSFQRVVNAVHLRAQGIKVNPSVRSRGTTRTRSWTSIG